MAKRLKDSMLSGIKTSASKPDGNKVTYSTLANIPRAHIQRILQESKPMIGGAKKCKKIWASIRKADFRKEGILNEANIELVFGKNKETIYELLKIQTVADFIDVFDRDKDGYLNEDEQVSIFSLIKEKMQLLGEELAKIHEYQLYKDLMKEVRALETDIVSYQNELRENIQKRQLEEYVAIGEEKLQEFQQKWGQRFEDFE